MPVGLLYCQKTIKIMAQSPNYVGRMANTGAGIGRKQIGVTAGDWDEMFNADIEEPAPAPVVLLKPTPSVPIPVPEPKLRRADPRDGDNFRPLRTRQDMALVQAKQLSDRVVVHEDPTSFGLPLKVTHLSSDDAHTSREVKAMTIWEQGMRERAFEGAKAISSEDLFGEQVSLLDLVTGKLESITKTVSDALSDPTYPSAPPTPTHW